MARTLITAARTHLSQVRPLRFHLTLLVLAAVVPMLGFAIAMVALFETQQRAALERSFLDTARALTSRSTRS